MDDQGDTPNSTLMTQRFIPYGRQWIDEADINAVGNVLRSDWITQGPTIELFESEVGRMVSATYSIVLANGTAALHAVCFAIGISPGDEVIVPTLTFAASANCVLYCGGKPVLCDIDPATLTIDVAQVERAITKKTKAIIAVDFAGHPAHWNQLRALAKKRKIVLVADSAHALGARYKNKPVGSLADLTIFSFHPVKAITTAEGGMVVTNRKKFADKIRIFRNHGIRKPTRHQAPDTMHPSWYQEMVELGYNYRITDMQAALGLSQLKKLEKFVSRRREIARQYINAFKKIDEIILPPNQPWAEHAWHLFTVQLKTKNRDFMYDQLKKKGVGTQVHYVPIHLQPYYQKRFGFRKGDFPRSEEYYARCLSIPLFPAMTDQQTKRVITAMIAEIR